MHFCLCVVHVCVLASVLICNWACVFIEEELHDRHTGKCVSACTDALGHC